MLHIMQIFAIILVAIAMAPALAHVFEFPGKMRLNRDAYVAVQAIYYPGFTIAGMSEPLSLIAVIVLLLYTPLDTAAFWLTIVALFGLLAMQVIYWTRTHPTNKYWLQSAEGTLGNVGTVFFAFDPTGHSRQTEMDWTKLRDRWEYSHITRAGLVFLSFLSLVLAIVTQD
jgi:hypothetical protein